MHAMLYGPPCDYSDNEEQVGSWSPQVPLESSRWFSAPFFAQGVIL